GIHVLFGLAAIVTGACAMLLHKGRGRHSNFGIAYFWCLFGVFVTMSALAFSRWQEDYDLFISPNARDEPPTDPRGVIRITGKLDLKNSILRDSAIEQKRQAEDHNGRGREPRSERGSACRYDQNPGGVSGMADEGVGSRGDDVLAAVGLDAND